MIKFYYPLLHNLFYKFYFINLYLKNASAANSLNVSFILFLSATFSSLFKNIQSLDSNYLRYIPQIILSYIFHITKIKNQAG